VPPTARNARTGEFTPPGICCWAREKSVSELDIVASQKIVFDLGEFYFTGFWLSPE
jgi:hypothetical protein